MAGLHLTLSPELESRLRTEAAQRHITAEQLAMDVLERQFAPSPAASGTENGPSKEATGAGLLARIQALRASVPEDEWAHLPTDLAEQHDHYLYGAPKK